MYSLDCVSVYRRGGTKRVFPKITVRCPSELGSVVGTMVYDYNCFGSSCKWAPHLGRNPFHPLQLNVSGLTVARRAPSATRVPRIHLDHNLHMWLETI